MRRTRRCWVRPTSCRYVHPSARCTPIEYSPWVVPRTLTFAEKMNMDRISPRFRRFVAMRRKWFLIVFAVSLILCATATNRKFDSILEIVGFALVGALVVTTAISLASAPIIWMISGKQKDNE